MNIPNDEIQWSSARSSGPGGQNVNKVSSKAILRWNLSKSALLDDESRANFLKLYPSHCTKDGDVLVMSQKTRDLLKNKEDALGRLLKMLEKAAKKPKRRIPTKPTRGSIERRLETKKRNAQRKESRRVSE